MPLYVFQGRAVGIKGLLQETLFLIDLGLPQQECETFDERFRETADKNLLQKPLSIEASGFVCQAGNGHTGQELRGLVQTGLVEQRGAGRWTNYTLKAREAMPLEGIATVNSNTPCLPCSFNPFSSKPKA